MIAASSGTFTDEKAMAAWVARMPQARIQAVHCAHWPMTECPQEVSAAVSSWMKDVFSA